MTADGIEEQLYLLASAQKAEILRRFFKTGKGEYGEGDRFIGVTVPAIRRVARLAKGMNLHALEPLLIHPVHECRMCGFLILVDAYERSVCEIDKEVVYNVYLHHREGLNNWDLVDLTSPKIVGDFLLHRDRSVLHQMIESGLLWEQRIAVLATFTFLRHHDFDDTVLFCCRLMSHKHDLIHKATGWMLREAGKRNKEVLITFLDQYGPDMPRTMLRYAIEKLPEHERLDYLTRKSLHHR